jgi:hypothetical protein
VARVLVEPAQEFECDVDLSPKSLDTVIRGSPVTVCSLARSPEQYPVGEGTEQTSFLGPIGHDLPRSNGQLSGQFRFKNDELVPREGFEPPAKCLEGTCSVH